MLSRIVDRKVVFVSQIEIALEIALKAYKGNTDKAGQPYILHPLRVMAKMPDEVSKAAALLEDNLNVLRLHELGEQDLRRVAKYHRAWLRLNEAQPGQSGEHHGGQ